MATDFKTLENTPAWFKILLAFIIIAFLIIAGMVVEKKNNKSYPQLSTDSMSNDNSRITASITKLIEDFKKADFIKKIDYQNNRADINIFAWYSLDNEMKEKVTRAIAQYCGERNKNELIDATLYNSTTGKKVASFNEFSGFEIY